MNEVMAAACLKGQETYQAPSLITSKEKRKEMGGKKRMGNENVRHGMREMDKDLTTKNIVIP